MSNFILKFDPFLNVLFIDVRFQRDAGREARLPVQSHDVNEQQEETENTQRNLDLHGAGRRLVPDAVLRQLRFEERGALPREKSVKVELVVLGLNRDVGVPAPPF